MNKFDLFGDHHFKLHEWRDVLVAIRIFCEELDCFVSNVASVLCPLPDFVFDGFESLGVHGATHVIVDLQGSVPNLEDI